jgi:hypothetical protein
MHNLIISLIFYFVHGSLLGSLVAGDFFTLSPTSSSLSFVTDCNSSSLVVGGCCTASPSSCCSFLSICSFPESTSSSSRSLNRAPLRGLEKFLRTYGRCLWQNLPSYWAHMHLPLSQRPQTAMHVHQIT